MFKVVTAYTFLLCVVAADLKARSAEDGLIIGEIGQPRVPYQDVVFSPSGKGIAASGYGLLRVWDSMRGKEVGALNNGAEYDIEWCEENQIVSAFRTSVILIDAVALKEIRRMTDSSAPILSIAVDPTNHRIYAGYNDARIVCFDSRTGKLLHRWRDGTFSKPLSMALSPQADRLYVVRGAELLEFDAAELRLSRQRNLLNGIRMICKVVVSPDGKQVVVSGAGEKNGLIVCYDVKAWEHKWIAMVGNDGGTISSVTFVPGDRRLLFCGGWTDVHDADNKKPLCIGSVDAESGTQQRQYPGRYGPLESIALTRDGKRVAFSDRTGFVRVFLTERFLNEMKDMK